MIIMTITSTLAVKECPNQPSSSTSSQPKEKPGLWWKKPRRMPAKLKNCNIAKLPNWKLNKKQTQHITTKHKTQACCNIVESEDLHMVGEDPRCEAMFALVHE